MGIEKEFYGTFFNHTELYISVTSLYYIKSQIGSQLSEYMYYCHLTCVKINICFDFKVGVE